MLWKTMYWKTLRFSEKLIKNSAKMSILLWSLAYELLTSYHRRYKEYLVSCERYKWAAGEVGEYLSLNLERQGTWKICSEKILHRAVCLCKKWCWIKWNYRSCWCKNLSYLNSKEANYKSTESYIHQWIDLPSGSLWWKTCGCCAIHQYHGEYDQYQVWDLRCQSNRNIILKLCESS